MDREPELMHERIDQAPRGQSRIAWVVLGMAVGIALGYVISRFARPWDELVIIEPTSNSATIASNGWLELQFSSPLDPASLADHVGLEPPLDGDWVQEGSTARFQPERALGYGASIAVVVNPGLTALDGAQVSRGLTVHFTVREPQPVYLQIGGMAILGYSPQGEPAVILSEEMVIGQLAPAPRGSMIAYTLTNSSGGLDLWLYDRDREVSDVLLECRLEVCEDPAWSSDGTRLAFTRREQGQDPDRASPRIWTISVEDRIATPLFQDERLLGRMPIWSPDGLGLAFFDPAAMAVRLLDLDTLQQQVIPGAPGRNGSWSPDGQSFVLSRQGSDQERGWAELILINMEAHGMSILTKPDQRWTDISQPAWSPDGAWIALAGQTSATGLAKGLFLLRPDGSELREIEANPGVSHGAYSWDPMGSWLLFQSFALDDPDAVPQVAVWQRDTGVVNRLSSSAYAPAWLP